MNIRLCQPADAEQICAIYNFYIETSIVTFEETKIDLVEMLKRIEAICTQYPFFVAIDNDEIVGYAYATQWKERSAYSRSVESTVYIKNNQHMKGIGFTLYKKLIEELKLRNLHCVIAGISLPNAASGALHEKLGFKKVAHFHEVGRKFNEWIDVGYWELLI